MTHPSFIACDDITEHVWISIKYFICVRDEKV